jgi:hypothetical protein
LTVAFQWSCSGEAASGACKREATTKRSRSAQPERPQAPHGGAHEQKRAPSHGRLARKYVASSCLVQRRFGGASAMATQVAQPATPAGLRASRAGATRVQRKARAA